MRITEVETFIVQAPIPRMVTDSFNEAVIWGLPGVLIHTDEGASRHRLHQHSQHRGPRDQGRPLQCLHAFARRAESAGLPPLPGRAPRTPPVRDQRADPAFGQGLIADLHRHVLVLSSEKLLHCRTLLDRPRARLTGRPAFVAHQES